MSKLLLLSCIVILIEHVRSDVYVDEIRDKCYKSKLLIYCGQYKLLKYFLQFYVDGEALKPSSFNSSGDVMIVKLQRDEIDFSAYPNTRQLQQENEVMKLMKFLTRRTMTYLNENGLLIHLPEESDVVDVHDGIVDVDEGRQKGDKGKDKKKMLIIPILLLFKMFKVKVLLGFVLAGVVFINKVLLGVALFLPAMFSSLKSHCRGDEQKVHYYHADDRYYYSDPEQRGSFNTWSSDDPFNFDYHMDHSSP